MAVSKRLRYEVLRRDNHACRYCGAVAPDAMLTVDHVIPVALGGSDEPGNLVAACRDCNAGKSASSPDTLLIEDVSSTAVRWAHAIRAAGLVVEADRIPRDEYRNDFLDAWNNWTLHDEPAPLPTGWPLSIDSFRAAGLPMSTLADCINECMYRNGVIDRFRYVCGIAWARVREQQALALAAVEQQDQQSAQQNLRTETPLGWPICHHGTVV